MTAGRWCHLDVKLILAETEKAFLLRLKSDDDLWVPKSVIADADDYSKGDKDCTISIAQWWAEKEGIE